MKAEREARIGIVGTGFVAQGLSFALPKDPHLHVSRILTRRNPSEIKNLAVEES